MAVDWGNLGNLSLARLTTTSAAFQLEVSSAWLAFHINVKPSRKDAK